MMHRDGPERKDAGKTYGSDDYTEGEKNEMEGQKKNPTPRRGVSLFFFRVHGEQGPLQTTTVVLSAQ